MFLDSSITRVREEMMILLIDPVNFAHNKATLAKLQIPQLLFVIASIVLDIDTWNLWNLIPRLVRSVRNTLCTMRRFDHLPQIEYRNDDER